MTAAPASPPRISRQNKVVLAVIGVAGIAIALWLTLGPDKRVVGPTDGPATSGGPVSNDPREAARAEVPEALALMPDTPAPGTRELAPKLPTDAAATASAIAATVGKDGPLHPRTYPGLAHGAPRMAGEVAAAITAKTAMAVSPFELALALGGILRTRGGEVEYGVVPDARFAVTELLARRFAVRVKTAGGPGPWLAADGGKVDGAKALPDLDLLGNVLAFRALGAIAKGDADLASRAAGLARRLVPDDPAILFVVGDAQIAGGLTDEARRTFDKATKLGSDAMTWYRLAGYARKEQRPFKADEYYKKAASLDATFAAPHVGLAELALERLDVTLKEEHAGILETARAEVAAAEKIDANATGIRLVKAHLASLDGKEDEGRAFLEEEVKLHPEEAMSFVMLANVYAAEQKDDDALKTLEAARAQGHETVDVLEGLGQLYALKQRFDEAGKAIEGALALDPESPTYRLQLAQLEREQGHLQKARKWLDEHMAKLSDEPTGRLLAAQLELADGKPEAARLHVDKVLAKDPNHREAALLAYFIGAVGNSVVAAERTRAIAVVGSRRKLAEMLLQNGLAQEAEVVLKDALTSEPEDMVAPVLLVALYTVSNRAAEATKLREDTLAKVTDAAQRAELDKLFEDALAQALRANAPPDPGHP